MIGTEALSVLPLVLAVTLLAAPAGQNQDQQPRLQIAVDRSCKILPDSDPSVMGDHYDAFRDDAVCHLESVSSSHHIEEKISEGERSRFFVRVAEQEYLMQNVTDKPAIFVVRHTVPKNWTVDSEPQPVSVEDTTAVFQVNAEPGQRMRLHVGMRRSFPIKAN